jgi:hypothetical protein
MAEKKTNQRVDDQRERDKQAAQPGPNASVKREAELISDDANPGEPESTRQEECTEEPRSRIDDSKEYKMISDGHPCPERRQSGRYKAAAVMAGPEQKDDHRKRQYDQDDLHGPDTFVVSRKDLEELLNGEWDLHKFSGLIW